MQLTREQANAIFRYKQGVLEKGFCQKVDRIDLVSACKDFYQNFLKINSPSVFIADCPHQALNMLNHLRGIDSNKDCVEIAEYGQFSGDLPITKTIDRSVFDLVKSLKQNAKQEVGLECFRELRNLLFRDFNFQFSQSVFQVIERSILKRWKEAGKSITEFSAHPSYADRDWLHFYQGCSELISVDLESVSAYQKFVDSGLFSGYFYKTFAVLVSVPDVIRKNENLVLHDEDEAAVKWENGLQLAYWNGVEVPLKLILNPDDIAASDILNETNAEVRRCYQEKLGSERFGKLLGLIVLDEKSDRFGNDQKLYRTKEVDKIAGDFIYFAKVVCPSTGRNYFLCVPPGLSGVDEAVAWTFGKTPGDYSPSIET